jgi:sporulation protein YlmC with PRC-barrel domain
VQRSADFHLGADVVDGDGRKIGTLARIIVEQEGFDARALVVKEEESFAGRLLAAESLFITDEVVVPITAVESATHDVIKLSMSAADIRRQPPYLSHHFNHLTPDTAVLEEADVLTGGMGIPRVEETAAKGPGQIEIDRGESVMLGTTGRRLGEVRDVLYDQGELIGVVIRPEGIFKKDVVLPIRFIDRADDLALFAHLDEADIEALKPFVDAEP